MVISILEEVWGGSFAWVSNRLGGHLEIPGYLKAYVAIVEDQPAAVGWVYFHEGSQFASLWGGSTVDQFRGRGLYTALVARRVQEAIRRGYRYLVIDTSPMSRPIVEKLGFRLLTFAQDYQWNLEESDA
jgi:GNAT superfamily N-acetyltransferase